MSAVWFYSFDGDQIGRQIQVGLLENDIERTRWFSHAVSEALMQLTDQLTAMGCEIIFAAGDNVLAMASHQIPKNRLPTSVGKITFSVGVGECPRDAVIALAIAKTRGPAEVVQYNAK